MNINLRLGLIRKLATHPPPFPPCFHLLFVSCCAYFSGSLQLQRIWHSLDVRVAHEHELGLYRNRKRCGVYSERVRGFVVVHAERGPLAREGGIQTFDPVLFRVRVGELLFPNPFRMTLLSAFSGANNPPRCLPRLLGPVPCDVGSVGYLLMRNASR